MENFNPSSPASPYPQSAGAGGKFRKPPISRKRPSTPYDRPPPTTATNQSHDSQDGGTGWLSKLVVNPARRLILSGANRILSSLFSQSESAFAEDYEDDSSSDHGFRLELYDLELLDDGDWFLFPLNPASLYTIEELKQQRQAMVSFGDLKTTVDVAMESTGKEDGGGRRQRRDRYFGSHVDDGRLKQQRRAVVSFGGLKTTVDVAVESTRKEDGGGRRRRLGGEN